MKLYLSLCLLLLGATMAHAQYEAYPPIVVVGPSYSQPVYSQPTYSQPVVYTEVVSAPVRQLTRPVYREQVVSPQPMVSSIQVSSPADMQEEEMTTYRRDSQCRQQDDCGCKDMFLSCTSGCGSFVLRCDHSGTATYKLGRCARGAQLIEYTRGEAECLDRRFVYYHEKGCDEVKWAFSKSCQSNGAYTVFISHRENALSCDWRVFCYATDDCKKRCEPRCDTGYCRQ